jgi:hypothetical protein
MCGELYYGLWEVFNFKLKNKNSAKESLLVLP